MVLAPNPVSTFLSGSRYRDFRDDAEFDEKCLELTNDLFGKRLHPRPPLGPNPFCTDSEVLAEIEIRFDGIKFETAEAQGEATFPYTDNNGLFQFGRSPEIFRFGVSTAGPDSIYVYTGGTNLASVALAANRTIATLGDPLAYDGSSRVRTVRVGESAVLINRDGKVAAIQPLSVATRDTDPDGVPRMRFGFSVLSPQHREGKGDLAPPS